MNNINLTYDEFSKLKEIGHGTDGCVFNYSKDLLIKVYHSNLLKIEGSKEILEKNDKIVKGEKIPFKASYNGSGFNYYMNEKDSDGVIKIRSKEALDKAIEKQKNIKRSILPQGGFYLDGKFVGLVIKKLNGIQIHKLSGMPIKYKYEIIKNLLLDIEELLENNIYHIDLGNSPYATILNYRGLDGNKKPMYGHSHVLVNPFSKKTNIIDLDGKSTIYMEQYNKAREQRCIYSLSLLLLEFLFKIDTKELPQEDEQYYELLENNVDEELARKLTVSEFDDFNDVKELIKKQMR